MEKVRTIGERRKVQASIEQRLYSRAERRFVREQTEHEEFSPGEIEK
jgi:hypothetical protein